MQQERGNILAPQTLARQKTFRKIFHPARGLSSGTSFGKNDVKAGVTQVKNPIAVRELGNRKHSEARNARPGGFPAGDGLLLPLRLRTAPPK